VILSLGTYVPLGDLTRIVVVVLMVAVVAPSAASLAIVGLDRRQTGSTRIGNSLIAVGSAGLLALVALGLDALINR
jgi:hypothetical protein